MFQIATPLAMFHRQIELLRTQLPGVLDGRLDSIHTARIATRRLREVLPLTHEWQRHHVADDVATRFKRMGRSLGRVRDADVRIQLLRYLESRIPPAGPSLVLVRQRQERDRLLLMRKLVKRFERLGVGQELVRLSTRSGWHRTGFWIAMTGAWRHRLRDLVAERAHSASDAVVHSTGVYFPNRTHEARIAIKKFRYAVEISAHTGFLADEPLIRTLKKTQDLLGELHDRQALIDELKDGAADSVGIDADQIGLVVRVAEAEIVDLHTRVLARRADVLEACCRAQRAVQRPGLPMGTLAVAGAVALAVGLEARRQRGHSAGPVTLDESAPEVSVRIPVAVPAGREIVDAPHVP
jgi:CHAD domain-containing protein